ncbi:hypothetical protein EV685_1089 [Sphaerotilus mobilis]|uniref:Uncharacterized protein n=2 Tax=Sphaerotilus mobilis TaxID=47994 RepID=A0A4Q7LXM3_9BURK|nr:hypothetical protein EV685_1089 [Sphaerotilus mobilis]
MAVAAALAWTLTLAGCGGGSSKNDSTSGTQNTVTTGKVTLTGVVSKGVMVGAVVTAHPVKDGVVDTATVLARGITVAGGRYTLPAFDAPLGSPVIVRAQVVDKTVHTDELSRQVVPLPTGFEMRSAIVPQVADTPSPLPVSITPYTEMLVNAAESGADKLDKASIDQGKSAVTQLLGFDPVATDVNGIAVANSTAVNAYGLMLAAVSQLATQSAALGCGQTDAGAAMACTVGKLADAAQLDSVQLQLGEVDVGAKLSAAVSTVAGNSTVTNAVDVSQTVDGVTQRLACVPGSLTNPCEVASVDQTVTGVAAAKAMFAAMRTSMDGWMSRGGTAGSGRLNQDAQAFEAAVTGAQVPLDQVEQDLAAIKLGIRLYEDHMAGRSDVMSKGARPGLADGYDRTLETNGTYWPHGGTWADNAIGCMLYKAPNVVATSKEDVAFIGCRSSVRTEIERVQPNGMTPGTIRLTDWRHGYTITPKGVTSAGNLQFDYTTSASKRVRARTCTGSVFPWSLSGCNAQAEVVDERVDLQLKPDGTARGYSGSIIVSPSSSVPAGLVVEVTGEMPGLIDGVNGALLSDRQSVTLTARDDGSVSSIATVSGEVKVYASAAASTPIGTLAIAPNSQITFVAANEDGSRPISGQTATGREINTARFGLSWTTPGAALSGTLTVNSSGWDRSGFQRDATSLMFNGRLDQIQAGVARHWITADLSMSTTGYDQHDVTLPVSASNPAYRIAADFSGTVTPTDGKPPFFLSLNTSKASNEANPTSLTGTLRMGTASAAKVNIQLSASVDALGAQTWTLHETVQDVTLTLQPHQRSTAIRQGSGQRQVGTIDLDRRRASYVDGSFESLDLGL